MAKDAHKLAGKHRAEETGRTPSGLFADENEFDRSALWRLGWWGAGAVGAVGLAVFTNQAARGLREDHIAAADLSRQAQLIQSLARETQGEARQLGAAIETLNSDRDRLYARVTVLEQGLESVTGALAKQSFQAAGSPSSGGRAAPPPQIAAVDSQPAPSRSPSPGPSSAFASVQPFMAAPNGTPGSNASQAAVVASTSPVQAPTGATAAAERAKPDGAKVPSAAIPSPTPAAGAGSPSSAPAPTPSFPATAAALVSSKSSATAPEPSRPAEAEKVARADSADSGSAKSAESSEATATAVQKTEFAVDLGGANSIAGLRALWRGLVKTNTDLAPLRPIIMLKESQTGLGMQLRLGAGPLSDAAAAARICAVLAESQRGCETTVYDGQRLGMRDEPESSDAAKPAAPVAAAQRGQRRRSFQPGIQQQRHGKREEPPAAAATPPPPAAEAPKPEQPALSSFFRRS